MARPASAHSILASEIPRHPPALEALWEKRGYWRNETIGDVVDAWAKTRPAHIAIQSAERAYTFAEVAEISARLAYGFKQLGWRKGDVVAIQLPSVPEFLLLFFALARMGVVAATIHMPYRLAEIEPLVRHARARAIICAPRSQAYDAPGTMLELRNRLPELETIVVAGADERSEILALGRVLRTGLPHAVTDKPSPKDPLVLCFTSGTTASPKAVLSDHRTLLGNNRAVVEIFGLRDDDVFLAGSPFTHVYGLGCAMTGFSFGVANALLPQFTPQNLAAAIERHRVTLMFAAPAHVASCLKEGLHKQHDLSSLRLAVLGGAFVAPELSQAWEAAMPNGRVTQLFGMTESQMTIAVPHDAPAERRWNFVGRPTPGLEMRVVGSDGKPLSAGDEGEVETRGYSVAPGYFRNEAATKAGMREGGWFRTGDVGVINDAGDLAITGRAKDIVNRGGIKINPTDIENLIATHEKVLQAAIVPMADALLGERACLFVTLKPGATLTLDEVARFLERHHFAKIKWPERLIVIPDMPLTPTRKIIKGELKKLL
ncbi:MAG: class I adenylate-forming enzyme family protein [Alphaproteobacteria bacterium]